MAATAGLPLIYKSSFDKANRTALASFRGVGMEAGLRVLAEVRRETGLPVLTDVHEREQIAPVAAVVDVLQTPAFLCRQTDFILGVARAGKPVNLKKGQFLSPWEMQRVVEKARSTGNPDLLVTERGFAFGYNNLVSDMRALPVLAETGCPVVFDATHSVQQPGGLGSASGGERRFVAPVARAALAPGVGAVFMEVHEEPGRAPSDGRASAPAARSRRARRASRWRISRRCSARSRRSTARAARPGRDLRAPVARPPRARRRDGGAHGRAGAARRAFRRGDRHRARVPRQ